MRSFSYPVLIVLKISGSSNNSLTEVFGFFAVETLSSSVGDYGMSFPIKLHNSSLSICFGMNFGIDTLTLGGSLLNSSILEL